jgi:eukaryotic-like serine/threonine-protein kinase
MADAIGQYRILDRIGSAGLGEVYRARDTRHGRTVAITVVASHIAGDADRRAHFLREVAVVARLSHPNIAALYEVGDDGQQLFLASEFVPGEVLARLMAGRPLNPRRASEFAAQIADGLAEAHSFGVVHGHLTTSSIVITPKDKAKIVDFGPAVWTSGEDNRGGQDDSATAGAVNMMLSATGDVADQSTDIRALGVVLFEMLTGRQPHAGDQGSTRIREIGRTRLAPSTVTRSVPAELDAIVAKAVVENAAGGYESAAAFATDLRSVAALLDARAERNEASRRRPSPNTSRGRSRLVWILIVVVIAVLAAAAWCSTGSVRL